MNKKLIAFPLVFLSILMAGCGSKQVVQPVSTTKIAQTVTKPQTNPQQSISEGTSTTVPSVAKSTIPTQSASTKKSTPVSTVVKPSKVDTINYADISAKTKAYIVSSQGSKTEAQKIIWDTTLLNRVNMESMYKQYLSDKGIKGNIPAFARYITLNAPIQSDWKAVFEKAVYNQYGNKIVSYKYVRGDEYQAYIMNNGKLFAYVGVNSRTGRYHG
ncbi:hypothetical protein KPL47_24840 [Clostridium estertheticum]|uniref:hypothetical protein n=1 Tax=Clostridium estertheticum TaxID=238834 RepID=UPI001C0E45DE|nr:hypothetical protein [Clostridium estertheticum]MBU3179498.1 hypothetical protein [Clostridium estertheticum]